MVTGSGPQLKVMMPPLVTAAARVPKSHDAGVPIPTTFVEPDVSTSVVSAGGVIELHEPL
jgi:hypothetical protein